VKVLGAVDPGDGGGGIFEWTRGAVDAVDGGTVLDSAVSGRSGGRWKRKYSGPLNARWFGVRGVAGVDDTAAISKAIAALKNGMTLLFPPGRYAVRPKIGTYPPTATFSLSNLHDIGIVADQATFEDLNHYANADSAALFGVAGCKNVRLELHVRTSPWASDKVGLNVVQLLRGTADADIDLTVEGGIAGVWALRRPSVSNEIGRRYQVKVRASHTQYPLLLEDSGDETTARIDAIASGRAFFIHGVGNVALDVQTLNPVTQSLIAAYGGRGCHDVDVSYYDRESTAATADAPLMSIQYTDTIPAMMRNIKIRFDIYNNAILPWHDSLRITKLDGHGKPDDIGRGHVLDGLDVSGVMEQQGRMNITNRGWGLFVGPPTSPADVQRNINIHDLKVTGVAGGGGIDLDLCALDGAAYVSNVNANVSGKSASIYMRNGGRGTVVYTNTQGVNFTDSLANTDVHVYIDTLQTAPQSTINKTFLNLP